MDKVLVEEVKVRNIRVDRIKVTVCRGSGMFKQALGEMVTSFLPEYSLRMNILCLTEECFCYLVLQNSRQVTSALQGVLIGCAKRDPVRVPELTPCRIEAEVLVGGTNSLCDSPV